MFQHLKPSTIHSGHPVFFITDPWEKKSFWQDSALYNSLNHESYYPKTHCHHTKKVIDNIRKIALRYNEPPILVSTGFGCCIALKYSEQFHIYGNVMINAVTHQTLLSSVLHLKPKPNLNMTLLKYLPNNTQAPTSWLLKMLTYERICERKILQHPMLFIHGVQDLLNAEQPLASLAFRMKATYFDRSDYEMHDAIVHNDILHWLDEITVKPAEYAAEEKNRVTSLCTYLDMTPEPSQTGD